MMDFIWLFFVASFVGWVLETIASAIKQKRFINRGLVNAPLCILYGSAIVFITVFCDELHGFWLFLGATLVATLFEWIAGHLIEKLYSEKWWDYSNKKWNLDGYICLSASLMWGILAFLMLKWGNSFAIKVFHLIPTFIGKWLLIVLSSTLFLDVLATFMVISHKNTDETFWNEVDKFFDKLSFGISNRLYNRINKRIENAYPEKVNMVKDKTRQDVFAYGLCFSKLFILFFVGSFIGDITETIYCRLVGGEWMSRSSLVWGPFSVVWGLGIALATMLLYKYRNKSDKFLFAVGSVLGGLYEYVCSVFTEIAFGKVFWEYSHMPLNLGGRINLLYCFFWGIAVVVWMKHIYPKFSNWIEKISVKIGKIIIQVLVIFMCINMTVSSLALIRSTQREHDIEAETVWQRVMDERFPDERLAKIYPNMIQVD